MRLLLKIYKLTLSPALKALFGGGCKFEYEGKLSCSEYMVSMIEKQGLLRGGLKGIKRVLKCNNWSV